MTSNFVHGSYARNVFALFDPVGFFPYKMDIVF